MKKFLIISLVFFVTTALHPQKGFTLTVGAGYGTASRMIPYPRVSDFDLREADVSLGSFLFPQIAVGYSFTDDIEGVLSLEYASKTSEFYGQTVDSDAGTIFIPVKDGYSFIPFELTLAYTLPFSSESFRLFIGGGGGLYFISSKREVAGIKPGSGGSKTGYGIHIVSGIDYYLNETTGVSFSMKFRDPEVEFKGEYETVNGSFNGKPVRLGSPVFNQKLSLEGTLFLLGLKVRL